VIQLLRTKALPLKIGGVYGQTHGPRFETAAEIRQLGAFADLVGMTCAQEIVLAQEKNIPYALICMVDNIANGVDDGKQLTEVEFLEGLQRNEATIETVLGHVLTRFPCALSATSSELKSSASAPSTVASPSSGSRLRVDLIVHARAIVPVEPQVVLDHYSLIVNKGIIVDLLPHAQAEAKYVSADVVDQRETNVLMPGFVNMHAHMGMSLLRGYADDYNLIQWLRDHIWPAEGKFVSPEFVADGTELALAEMIRGGQTMINDMFFFPNTAAKVVDEVGVRATIGMLVFDFPSAYGSGPAEYIAKGKALREHYLNHPRLRFAWAPHAPYSVSEPVWEQIRDLAAELKVPIHTHLHETRAEVEMSERGEDHFARHKSDFKITPIDNFKRMGLITSSLIAAHMTQLTEDHISTLAAAKANIVHCPSSNLKLVSGLSPIHKCHHAGVNVCIGTDSCASNNGLDMFMEMRTASILGKLVADDATACPAYTAITMATLNGARALGVDNVTGSLKVGKSADFISLNIDCLEMLPIFDVVSHIVYVATRDRVTDVWVAGSRLLAARQLTTIREANLMKRVKEWNVKILAHKRATAAASKSAHDTSTDSKT